MTIQEKLAEINAKMAAGKEGFDTANGRNLPTAPLVPTSSIIDPADAFACEGCQ